ncbi:unnamed protein product [Mortierella alpina]
MRITPNPFATSSRGPTPSSSSLSLNTLVKDDSRSTPKTTPQTKPAQSHSQRPPASRAKTASSAALPASATPRIQTTAPEKPTKGDTLLNLETTDVVTKTPIAAKHLARAWTPSSTSNFLSIDTHQKPLWRSQSSDGLSSPSPLEGIVIESMKSPIQKSHGHVGTTTRGAIMAARPKDMAKGSAGDMFEPEHDSVEGKGVPWMLYRHKSRSTGTIPYTYASTSLEAASAMETGAVVTPLANTTRDSDTRGARPVVPARKEVLTKPARAEGSSGRPKRSDTGTVASAAVDTSVKTVDKNAAGPLPESKANIECPAKEPSENLPAVRHRPQRRDPGTASGKSQPSARRKCNGSSNSQLLSKEKDLAPTVEPQGVAQPQPVMQPQPTVQPQLPTQSQQATEPEQTTQPQLTVSPQLHIQTKQPVKLQRVAEDQQIIKSQQIAERWPTVHPQEMVEPQSTAKPPQTIAVERPPAARLAQTFESHSSPLCHGEKDERIGLKADAPAPSVLAVRTARLSTPRGPMQGQNNALQQPTNHSSPNGRFRPAQQLDSRHIEMGMDSSSPSTLFSHNSNVHSPALSDTTTTSSNHTESTFVSETYPTSSATESTNTSTSTSTSSTGHSSQTTRTISRWSTTPSPSLAHSDTASSVDSTLYHHPHHYDHHHPHHHHHDPDDRSGGFVRGYITRVQKVATSVSTATGTATLGALSRAQRFFQTNRLFIIFASDSSATPSSTSALRGGPPPPESSFSVPGMTPAQPSPTNWKDRPDKASSWRWYSNDGHRRKHPSSATAAPPPPPPPPSQPPASSSLFLSSLPPQQGPNGHRYIPGPSGKMGGRKGPKRPDEKTFFSNERTYMHWIKFGLLLGSMALTLCSFGQEAGLGVGLFLVAVAMSTLVYATTIYHLRHRWMARARMDVRYYDRVGPSVLFLALFMAYATNVGLTLHKLVDKDDEGLNFYNINGPMDV